MKTNVSLRSPKFNPELMDLVYHLATTAFVVVQCSLNEFKEQTIYNFSQSVVGRAALLLAPSAKEGRLEISSKFTPFSRLDRFAAWREINLRLRLRKYKT